MEVATRKAGLSNTTSEEERLPCMSRCRLEGGAAEDDSEGEEEEEEEQEEEGRGRAGGGGAPS